MTPKQRENRRSHPGHTLQWPAFLSIWQVSQFGPVLGHLPFPPISLGEHSPSCHTISMQRIPCPDLPVYVWPLPGHSIPCYAIPYLCLPDTVSGHALPAILEHTSPRLSIRAGFPSTQEDATPHLVSQVQSSLLGIAMFLIWSHPGDCDKLPSRAALFIWTLKINIWWSHAWTVSLLMSPGLYCSDF